MQDDRKTGSMGELRSQTRYPLAVRRDCTFAVITFKDLVWKDHLAQLLDISSGGIGLASEGSMDRGFVWFRDRVAGNRGGVLLWSRPHGRSYRAGIQFVPLSRDQESYLRDEFAMVREGRSLRDPRAMLATITGSLSRHRPAR